MTSYWGYQLLLDCAECDKNVITAPDKLKAWVTSLVKKIQMVPYGEPQVIHFGHNQTHLEGWTVLQLIETSNITAHFNDHTGEGYIDVFSCQPFDIDAVVRHVEAHIRPTKIRVNFLTRQA